MHARAGRAGAPRERFLLSRNAVLRISSVLGRRWRPAVAAAVVLLVTLTVVVYRIGAARDAEMRAAAAGAATAIREARAADAMTWAPDELLASERRHREALTSQRIEEARVWPIPRSGRVVAAYGDIEQTARRALALASERRAAAEKTARALIEDASRAVESSESVAAAIHLGTERRNLLARARLALTEARVYEREGDLGRATVRARDASALAGQVRDHAAGVAARYADAQTLARWQRWKNDTIAWSRREGGAAIVVAKEAHLLTLYVGGKPLKTYRVDLGFNWIADKASAGDGATPEGQYRIVSRVTASAYYRALLLDYPNATDRAEFARARRSGDLPRSAGIGGLIEIHGEGGRGRDWTKGCVALANPDMADLFARVGVGTPVTIVGSDDFGAIAEFAAGWRDSGATNPR